MRAASQIIHSQTVMIAKTTPLINTQSPVIAHAQRVHISLFVHTAERHLADPYDIERQDIFPEVYTIEFWLRTLHCLADLES